MQSKASLLLILSVVLWPGDLSLAGGGSYQTTKTKKNQSATPCPTPKPGDYRKAFREAAKAMDTIASDVEEFGSVSMSVPLLTLPTDNLAFGLNNDAKFYYDNAKREVTGRALSVTKIAQSLSGDFQGTADLDAIAAAKSALGLTQQQNQLFSRQVDSINKQADAKFKADMAVANSKTNVVDRQNAIATAFSNRADILSHIPSTPAPAATPTPVNLPGSAAVIVNNSAPTATPSPSPAPTPAPQPLRVDNSLITATTILDTLPGFTGVDASGNAVTPMPFNDNISLPDTSAVIAAESARSLQALSNFFHSPTEAMQFKGKVVMMGAVTVSVQPGWRTQKGFAAEVSVHTFYDWQPASRETLRRMSQDSSLPIAFKEAVSSLYRSGTNAASDGAGHAVLDVEGNPSHRGIVIPPELRFNPPEFDTTKHTAPISPLVSGISPLMQTETLDLASEFQRQDQFALALALALQGSGYKAQGKIFEQFVKTQKNQVQTRSTTATVATYSNGGGIIGFQIGPRLKAIGDPANRKSKAENILERQSFPALLVFGLDAADLYPKACFIDGKLAVYEPVLSCQQQIHWMPLTHRFNTAWDWLNPLNSWPPGWWEPAYTEAEKIKHSIRKIEAFSKLDCATKNAPAELQDGLASLKSDITERHLHNVARALGIGSSTRIPSEVLVPNGRLRLPKAQATGEPQLTAMFPPNIAVVRPGSAAPADPQAVASQVSAVIEAFIDFDLFKDPATKSFTGLETPVLSLTDPANADKLTKYAQSVLPGADDKTPPQPSPAQIDQVANELRNLASTIAHTRQILGAVASKAEDVRTLAPATGTPPPEKDRVAAAKTVGLLRTQVERLDTKVGVLKSFPAQRLAKIKELSPDAKITEAATAADRVVFYSQAVMGTASELTTLLGLGANDPVVTIAAIGENLDKVERIDLITGPGLVDNVKLGEPASEGLSTTKTRNQILMKVRVHGPTEIHLKLYYEVPTADDPSKSETRSIFTPSVLVNFNGQAPTQTTSSGGALLNLKPAGPIPSDDERALADASDTGRQADNPLIDLLNAPAVDSLQVNSDLFPPALLNQTAPSPKSKH